MNGTIYAYMIYVLNATFAHDLKIQADKLGSLIGRNAALGNPAHGFLFGGRFWSFYPKKSQLSLSKRVLHPDLQVEGTAYMAEVVATERDQTQLKQRLQQLLRDCETEMDMRDALPEAALQFLPDSFQSYPRTRPEGWPLQSKPLLMEDFKRTTEIFLFYSANRMLY